MTNSLYPRLACLDVLVGDWEVTAASDERVMSVAQVTFEWLGEHGGFLCERSRPPTFLVPEWVGAAPEWANSVIGLDDYSDAFTKLYADSRGVSRTYRMTFDGSRWTMASRPGEDFHQRFEGTINDDHTAIEGRWEASEDGREWTTDFHVAYRRLTGSA